MHIFDTKTRQIEEFKPLKSSEVKIYYCGPTVYNYAHLGNLKTSVVEDVVVKTLKFLGYNVKTTMNITDIEDKIIRESHKAQKSLKEFTQEYTKEFFIDLEKLGIELADNVEPVTNLIPEMVRMIQTMLTRGFAYYADDGSIYYDISKYKKYGQLAHLDMQGMKSSVRIDNDEYEKDNVADFVLWKAWKPEDGENYWEESFVIPANAGINKKDKVLGLSYDSVSSTEGQREATTGQTIVIKGRPGWHIECSACAMKHFGPQIDIHMGGEDLIFPHHQNEIAQTEACTRKEFSKYWIHSGHLMVGGKKMSKSLGNFYNLRDVEKKFPDVEKSILYRAIRLSFINGNYRDTIDFSFEKLEQLIATIKNIDKSIKKLQDYESDNQGTRKDFSFELQLYISDYINALENDFAIPEALSVFFEFQKYVTGEIREGKLSEEEKQSAIDMYATLNQVFGIIDFNNSDKQEEEIPEEILQKLEERNRAKSEKNFEKSDALRDELIALGYSIKDTREGSHLEKI